MRIAKINGSNFKGRTFTDELKPITVLTGQNFAGKSARIEAAQLALAGFLPGIERLNGKIFSRLSSGNPMSVGVEFTNGKAMTRAYRKDADAVSCTIHHRGLSIGWKVQPVMIEPREFLGLSAKERVKFLFQRIKVENTVTPATLIEAITQRDIAKVEAAAAYITHWESELFESYTESVENFGGSTQAWLESVINSLNQTRRELDALAKRLGLQAKPPEARPALNRTTIKERKAKAEAAVTAARDAWAIAEAALKSAVPNLTNTDETVNLKSWERELETATRHLTTAQGELDGITALQRCPHCGAHGKGWRERLEKTAQARVKEMETHVNELIAKVNSLGEALKAKDKLIDRAKAAQDKALAAKVSETIETLHQAYEEQTQATKDYQLMEQQDAAEAQRITEADKRADAGSQLEVIKQLCEIAQAELDRLVGASINPFLERINGLCGGILKAPVTYQDGEFGLRIGSGATGSAAWTWRSFSGTEELLFMTAVSIAFAAESELKVAFIDEVGRLDENNKLKLLDTLRRLIDNGWITQAILIEAGDGAFWEFASKESKRPDEMAVIRLK